MKRVYVAGPISGNTLEMLANIRAGIKAAAGLVKKGYSVFSPHLDFQFNLVADDGHQLTVEEYQKHSMAWLEVADIVYVLKGWSASKGTLAEVLRATHLGIPVKFQGTDIL